MENLVEKYKKNIPEKKQFQPEKALSHYAAGYFMQKKNEDYLSKKARLGKLFVVL